MTGEEARAPLVPAEVDLREFMFMPVDTQRLLKSDTWVLGTHEERCAAFTLWLESWHQVPAGSLPDNDRMLAHLSQAGARWQRVKDHAMRGWVRCADGRLYHPVVAEKALEAWAKHKRASSKGKAGAAKRWGTGNSTGTLQLMPTDSNGQGHGTGIPQSPNGSRRRRQAGTPVPEAFEVTADMAQWAIDRGLSRERIEPETMKFLNYHKGKGSLQADWTATWRTWVMNAIDYGARH